MTDLMRCQLLWECIHNMLIMRPHRDFALSWTSLIATPTISINWKKKKIYICDWIKCPIILFSASQLHLTQLKSSLNYMPKLEIHDTKD